jgi:hypothetical protein
MSENTTIRLMKAAKEFNVGKNTIIEFLHEKGFQVDNKPDPVLSAEMYDALIEKYDAERAAKRKSDNIILAKTLNEEKKAKEKDKPAPEKIKIAAPDVEGPKILGKIDIEEKPIIKKQVAEKTTKKTKSTLSKEASEQIDQEENTTTSTETEVQPEIPTTKKKKNESEIESIKVEAPELEGPKILGKIDLNPPTPAPKKKSTKKEQAAPATKQEPESPTSSTTDTLRQKSPPKRRKYPQK